MVDVVYLICFTQPREQSVWTQLDHTLGCMLDLDSGEFFGSLEYCGSRSSDGAGHHLCLLLSPLTVVITNCVCGVANILFPGLFVHNFLQSGLCNSDTGLWRSVSRYKEFVSQLHHWTFMLTFTVYRAVMSLKKLNNTVNAFVMSCLFLMCKNYN